MSEEKITYIEDHVVFRMPSALDYQFAALAIVQSFVDFYDKKMELAHVLPTDKVRFRLHYKLEGMSAEELDLFRRMGLELKYPPEELDHADMELNFTEDRAFEFFAFDRHVCQIYGGLSGVQVNPVPRVRQVKPALDGEIVYIDDADDPLALLMAAEDNRISCVVGRQSWLTYWSIAMGLPTVEIIDADTKRTWMSKWYSPVYRMIEHEHINLLPQCLQDLAEVVAELKRREEKAA